MNKNKNNKEEAVIPPTNYKFYLGSRQRYIHLSCQFESGNVQLVRQMSQFHYRLSCIDDGLKTNHRVNSKSWFYFSIHGFPKNTKGKFSVSRVQTLMAVYSYYPKSYRPVYRQCFIDSQSPQTCNWSKWNRIPTQSPLTLRQTGQLQCSFDFLFKNENHKVEFALVYPYTYAQNIKYLNALNEYYCHEEFYFHKEVLARSPEGRDIHLLTITSHDHPNKDIQNQELFDQLLFPEKCRPKRFKKPVILITARVHPGQASASYAMEGIVDFLINNNDLRSYLLKKMFVFMIVPMINVDGVYHGNFRMDIYGKNLNRYYIDPSFENQPAVYGIKSLANHLIKDNRLSFYFDLHAHNAKKGAFIYGNAINDFVEQVESQVFCKLFAMNNADFQYEYCNFSQKQMNSKDRNEDRTKQGCGRVVMHKIANIIHSYSLQCGIISASKHHQIPSTLNNDFKIGEKGLIEEYPSAQSNEPEFFTIQSYKNLGKSMLVSILDVFDKNPYNRVYNSEFKSLEFLRRVTAFEVFHHAQRFRMFQKYVYGKVRNINELIKEVLNSKLHYRELYNFYFYNDKELKNLEWPENVLGLTKPKYTSKLKRFKSLQEPRVQYSQSFINDLKVNKQQLQSTTLEMEETQQLWTENITKQEKLQENDNSEVNSSQTQNSHEDKEIDQGYLNQILGNYEKYSSSQKQIMDNNSEYQRNSINWKHEELKQSIQMSKDKFYSSERVIDIRGGQHKIQSTYSDKIIQFHQINNISYLKGIEKCDQFDEKSLKPVSNESPSVRVRRLLKQENAGIKKLKQTSQVIKKKINEMTTHTNVHMANSKLFANNDSYMHGVFSNSSGIRMESGVICEDNHYKLFEEIKLEIKEELRKHKDKKMVLNSSSKPQHKKSMKGNHSEIKEKEDRIKSTNLNFLNLNNQIVLGTNKNKSEILNRMQSKSSINRNQLPALKSHLLVISSNSSRGLIHKQ